MQQTARIAHNLAAQESLPSISTKLTGDNLYITYSLTNTFLSPMEGLVWVRFISMLVVEFSWTRFEVKMGFIYGILKHGTWATCEGRNGHEWFFGFWITVGEGNDAQENVLFYLPKQAFDHLISLRKSTECLCDPMYGDNSSVEHLHQFLCQNVQTTTC